MKNRWLQEYCLSKKGATSDFKIEWDARRFLIREDEIMILEVIMDIKEKIKYFYEYVSTNNLVDEFPEYISDHCTVRYGENIFPVGIEGMKQHQIDVRKTYPEMKIKVIRQYCDRDYVISEITTEAIHMGEWLGMKPSGKKLFFTGVNIDKIEDGKIVEHGGALNTFEALFEAKIIQPSP